MQIQRPAMMQEQKLKLSPQMLQGIQILAMPLQDLQARIQEELEVNPALEVVEERKTVSIDEFSGKSGDYEAFENTSDPGNIGDYTTSYGGYDDEASEAKRKFMEGAIARPESLQDHLIWQLRLQPLPDEFFQIGELLIRNLDGNGFHREDPLELVPEEMHPALRQVMSIIQGFEPQGTCTANYQDSLLVQARLSEEVVPSSVIPILEHHLELLEKGRLKEIARQLKVPEHQIERSLEFIQTLTPFPGREYSATSPQYVIPDLMITQKDGEFVIILNDEEIPVLGVNAFFDEVLQSQGDQKEVKQFVTSKIRDARWFIQTLQQRNKTLLKVAKAIVEFQRDFFLRGPKYIVPLTLRDIAGEIGVHEATVSRLTNGKYVHTDFGLFELKYFFSNAVAGTNAKGIQYSKEGVKAILKEILDSEQGGTLSDQKLADLLKKRGVSIARRTVAKYRKELDISSSYDRP
ncbi:RNA polymerase factor sigma-54 [Spirochaeta lutea]|uniref:RNA polymerase sigma54 factor n=1 Tax=Spirochaeta lutea TaxID=1480694 RepID=A0A098QZH8_9SPIO|nr:RNA polymerase factor sigma-54 [Spirochaeta lutea]KGE71877.1 RNA polymerase sigma54 factor [Spirochaeta lutea]